jgi:hypothetical protein
VLKVNKTLTLDPDLIGWLNQESISQDRSMSYLVNLHLRRIMDQRRKENDGESQRATE